MSTMDNFVGLSAVLTGFAQSILNPTLDEVNIKAEYLPVWREKVASESGDSSLPDSILNAYQTLRADTTKLSDQQIGEQMLSESRSDAFLLACRQLIYLWYMGAWPTVSEAPGTATGGRTDFYTLSSKSYTAGLVWQVMQAHPMGDSNYRYGYWAEPPVALNNFTGHAND